MSKKTTFKRHGIRLTSQEISAAKHRRLACHPGDQPLHPLLSSICYKRFNLETSAPSLSGNYFEAPQQQSEQNHSQNQYNKQNRKGDRSESARRMKGKGKGKKSNEGSNSQPSSFAQTSTIPPWPTPETALTQPQAPIPPGQAATATMGTELLSAVRKTYPDISQAPEDIKKAVEKADKAASKALSKDLNKASYQVGKAAKQRSSIKEARSSHRQNCLKHLRDSVTSWQTQLQLFKDQQKQYGEQPATASASKGVVSQLHLYVAPKV